jgi:regulator of sigma E protease
MPNTILKPIAFIVLLGVLIFVHELGHYLVAKLLRVKVLRFSIGFGPPIFSFHRGETEYRVAWIPLGGYVKMAGADPTEEVAPEDRGRGFLDQRPWRRLLISVAGPAMNLLLPFLLLAAVFWGQNGRLVPAPVVGTVVPGSPADRAGLKPGDRVLTVEGPSGKVSLRYFADLQREITPHPGQPLQLEVERAGRVLPPMTLRPGEDERLIGLERVRQGVIGITGNYPQARVAPVAPGAAGPVEPFDLVIAVNGAPVKHAVELTSALELAACQPAELEVLRERPRTLPGAVLADYTRERLAQVPTCRDGKPSLRVVDPWLSAAVAAVEPGGPAAQAGVKRGDVITAVNGKPVHNALELQTVVSAELGTYEPGTLTLADGRTLPITASRSSRLDELSGKTVVSPTLGLHAGGMALADARALDVPRVELRLGPGEIIATAWEKTVEQIRLLLVGIAKMFSGEISTRHVGGFIQIVQETGRAVELGLEYFIGFMAFISVNLAIMNLLPIPVLDGGQIVQSLLEAVTRRPLSIRMREIANVVGLILIVSLMIFAFHNDIMRLFQRDRPVSQEVVR